MPRGLLVPVIAALVSASCSASYPAAPSPATTTAVQVFYTRAMAYPTVGSSYLFSAYAIKSDGAYEDVTSAATWSSSDPQAFRPLVTPGYFTASAPGAVVITARYQSAQGTLSTYVIRADRQIYPYLSISGGDPRTIGRTATAFLTLQQQSGAPGQNVSTLATWTSSDPNVATADGPVIAAVGPGTARITATYNGLTAFLCLSVVPGQ